MCDEADVEYRVVIVGGPAAVMDTAGRVLTTADDDDDV